MHRRQFLRATAYTSLAALAPGCWSEALTSPAEAGTGPYGPLSASPDVNGLFLPAGFRSRIVAVGGEVVAGTGYEWHPASDGAATFATPDGGWILVSNSEVGGGAGGASALRFGPPDRSGVAPVRRAARILTGTNRNCAGGPTPWGTWLSCEETESGRVWECDPDGRVPARPLDALGRFPHEAAAVDPATGQVYLTEDAEDCRLFRFTPAQRTPPGVRPGLDQGRLEVAAVGGGNAREGRVSWLPVDPADRSTHRPAGSRRFTRLEGAWYHGGRLYVAATSLSEIYELEVAGGTLRLLYEKAWGGPLTEADNVTVHAPSGDLFVTEDHGNMEIVVLAGGEVAPVVRVHGHEGSELTGPAFDPTGERLYFASQRGSRTAASGAGVIYEVSGPFRRSGEVVRAAARQPAPRPSKPAPQPTADRATSSTTAPPTTTPPSSSSTAVLPSSTSSSSSATSLHHVAVRQEAAAPPIGSSAGGEPGALVAIAGAGAAATAAMAAKLARSERPGAERERGKETVRARAGTDGGDARRRNP